ncbi:hypothetical protein [Flavobacterium celericrescens]|uniref:Uncharacterized protein n=1 Tax=Flavobacterium celericrescens TaxID=2709780 RepID=A0ABX0IF83_9FLAO|nr:hypothetical protein [Flavobacterium celericrescens]NHM04317.1 hypothetical protein [Flavobacterium celericrescens]
MAVQICTCEGLDVKCKKCFGSGYINTDAPEPAIQSVPKKGTVKQESFLPEHLHSLSRKEIENIVPKIIDTLDLKSKKQMQILNSIPFNTTTFRRDFKAKFELLQKIEDEKQALRNDLDVISDALTTSKYTIAFNYGHFLSDKVMDVTSNRDLKTLIRTYKKLKK